MQKRPTLDDLQAAVERYNNQKPWNRPIERTYDYNDAEGNLAHQTVRFALPDISGIPEEDQAEARKILARANRFSQRVPHPKPARREQGFYQWSLKGVERVLYRLPGVIAAIAGNHPVIVVEGEKDADTLDGLGICATTCAMGAGSWSESYTETLAGADVILLGDHDEVGRKHVKKVSGHVYGRARRVRELRLTDLWPDAPEKADISDAVEALGLTREHVLAGIREQARAVEPPPEPSKATKTIEQRSGLPLWVHKRVEGDLVDEIAADLGKILAPTHVFFRRPGVPGVPGVWWINGDGLPSAITVDEFPSLIGPHVLPAIESVVPNTEGTQVRRTVRSVTGQRAREILNARQLAEQLPVLKRTLPFSRGCPCGR